MVNWGNPWAKGTKSYLSICQSITQITLTVWLLKCVRKRKTTLGTELLDVGVGLGPQSSVLIREQRWIWVWLNTRQSQLEGNFQRLRMESRILKSYFFPPNKLRIDDCKIIEEEILGGTAEPKQSQWLSTLAFMKWPLGYVSLDISSWKMLGRGGGWWWQGTTFYKSISRAKVKWCVCWREKSFKVGYFDVGQPWLHLWFLL